MGGVISGHQRLNQWRGEQPFSRPMVHKLREKRSRIKNRCTNIPDYPRDIWHFVSRSGERVINTKTGNLLKDVLDAQSLSQSDTTKIQRELKFPKTIQKAIDLEQLQQRSVSANPEKEAAARLRAQRWAELEAAPQQTEKRSGGKTISDRRVPFDIDQVDSMITTYRTENRPAWLLPQKNKQHAAQAPDSNSRDLSMGMSKAKQDEMINQMAINEANRKMDRAHALQKRFSKTCARLKLERVASDLSLNRMFLKPECAKAAHLTPYFADKTLDPYLSVEKIETASPTQFFRMLHRTMPLHSFRPQPYQDIVR